jgi:hypothetical protein
MKRREFTASVITRAGAISLGGLGLQSAFAAAAAGVSETDAASGVRAALEKGANTAVASLGKPGGFLSNPKVRIPLPGYLEQASKVLKMTGQGQKIDELVTAMNQAAEAAVPLAKPMLVQAVKSMSVDDALNIVRGGNNSATQYFAGKTRTPLTAEFLPVVTKQTEKVGLAQRYNDVAGKVSSMGLIKGNDANIQQYVTGKALDGLYLMIGEEEAKIRTDPIGTGSALLKKVFG